MDSLYGTGSSFRWVSPFRHLRVYGYLLLTAAFRSLSRLSSALSAKASTLRPYKLDLSLPRISVSAVQRPDRFLGLEIEFGYCSYPASKTLRVSSVWRIRQIAFHKNVLVNASILRTFCANLPGSEQLKIGLFYYLLVC